MSKPRIAIIDYGMGNILSVRNAFQALGYQATLENDPDQLNGYDFLILPGVGAFEQAMSNLQKSGLMPALNAFKTSGKGILGICLGMQLLCTHSSENGQHPGLNWIKAEVIPFIPDPGRVIPHMGWNEVHIQQAVSLLAKIQTATDFYFVHSYHVNCADDNDIIATTPYGIHFSSIIQHENITGIQFHPEKSQANGLRILDNFIRQPC